MPHLSASDWEVFWHRGLLKKGSILSRFSRLWNSEQPPVWKTRRACSSSRDSWKDLKDSRDFLSIRDSLCQRCQRIAGKVGSHYAAAFILFLLGYWDTPHKLQSTHLMMAWNPRFLELHDSSRGIMCERCDNIRRHVSLSLSISVHVSLCVCVRGRACACACVCVCMYMCMYMYMYMYIYICCRVNKLATISQ